MNINAPMTLNRTFYTSVFSETINVNDDVIITQPTKASGAGNMNFNIAVDKSLTLSAPNSIQDGTGAWRVSFTFTGANSVLNIDGTNTTIRWAITNGANGTLNVNAGVTTATDSTVTPLQKTNITDNTTFNIDSVNSNMNLLNNRTSIAFKGASSELDLINTGNADKQFTLYSNLNP
ncbi:Cell surface antigen-like protein Sca7 [Rickettsia akari str. Hartford]|uniref:Cell surface antigen-like protein Sca7 n=2 Tax=Rickettsia akari TaxID=786 RepID=A8GMV5_RICAH|nr:Cell surface antigen-like protein Sca7 [Rickettsia akari str. Hartford]